MRRRVINLLILLPLAILISLPCSIKQDIKQLLNIPINTSASMDKSANSSACSYTFAQDVKSDKEEQRFDVKPIFEGSFLSFTASSDIGFYQSTGADPGTSSTIPIFIIYRKLII